MTRSKSHQSSVRDCARKGRKATGDSAYPSNRNRNFVEGPKRVSSPRSLTHIRSLIKFCHCYTGLSEISHSEDGNYSSLRKSKWVTSQWSFSVKRGGWIHLHVISCLKRFGTVRWKGTRLRHNSVRMQPYPFLVTGTERTEPLWTTFLPYRASTTQTSWAWCDI